MSHFTEQFLTFLELQNLKGEKNGRGNWYRRAVQWNKVQILENKESIIKSMKTGINKKLEKNNMRLQHMYLRKQ
jgi:hypothetical protein